jgi:hypothetical protein
MLKLVDGVLVIATFLKYGKNNIINILLILKYLLKQFKLIVILII